MLNDAEPIWAGGEPARAKLSVVTGKMIAEPMGG
jgi:hypothetical protein